MRHEMSGKFCLLLIILVSLVLVPIAIYFLIEYEALAILVRGWYAVIFDHMNHIKEIIVTLYKSLFLFFLGLKFVGIYFCVDNTQCLFVFSWNPRHMYHVVHQNI